MATIIGTATPRQTSSRTALWRWIVVLAPGAALWFARLPELNSQQEHLLAVFVATIIALVAQPVRRPLGPVEEVGRPRKDVRERQQAPRRGDRGSVVAKRRRQQHDAGDQGRAFLFRGEQHGEQRAHREPTDDDWLGLPCDPSQRVPGAAEPFSPRGAQ